MSNRQYCFRRNLGSPATISQKALNARKESLVNPQSDLIQSQGVSNFTRGISPDDMPFYLFHVSQYDFDKEVKSAKQCWRSVHRGLFSISLEVRLGRLGVPGTQTCRAPPRAPAWTHVGTPTQHWVRSSCTYQKTSHHTSFRPVYGKKMVS